MTKAAAPLKVKVFDPKDAKGRLTGPPTPEANVYLGSKPSGTKTATPESKEGKESSSGYKQALQTSTIDKGEVEQYVTRLPLARATEVSDEQ